MQNNNHNENNIINPFIAQHPAQPRFFAGRKLEINEFRKATINSARLDPPAPINFAIRGSWGMGKTSLLYEFMKIALDDLQNNIKCTSFYFPLSPRTCRTWDDFSDHFLRNIRSSTKATEGIREKIMSEIRNWEVDLNLGPATARRRKESSSLDLLDSLEVLWQKHLEPEGTEVGIVFLDDLHYFPITADDSSYLNLRTTFQELVHRGCNYSLVVTASSLLFEDTAGVTEPLARFFTHLTLSPFTAREATEVIGKRLATTKQGIEVEEPVVEALIEKTKGHPYLIIFAMSHLMTELDKPGKINMKLLERCWPTIKTSLGQTIFGGYFQRGSPQEREFMEKIAKSGREVFSASDFASTRGAGVLLSRLEEKELLIRKDRGQYSFFHPLFADYLTT
jgi:hypothetical protein